MPLLGMKYEAYSSGNKTNLTQTWGFFVLQRDINIVVMYINKKH